VTVDYVCLDGHGLEVVYEMADDETIPTREEVKL
jgi:hypothetical protein